jgi:hypothetical protein
VHELEEAEMQRHRDGRLNARMASMATGASGSSKWRRPTLSISTSRTDLPQEANIERHHRKTIGRIWLHRRERLSLRFFADLDAIIDSCCGACDRLIAKPGRNTFLPDYPYLRSVRTS